MNRRIRTTLGPKHVKFIAAVVVGLSVGTLVSPAPVEFPLAGSISGYIVGVVGLLVGGGLYRWVPSLFATEDCGCDGDCGCS